MTTDVADRLSSLKDVGAKSDEMAPASKPRGAYRKGAACLLDRFLETIAVEMFTPADVRAYGEIVYELGYSRPLTLDRLIAAQALARDARLITRNGRDFRNIPGLRLEVWPTPA